MTGFYATGEVATGAVADAGTSTPVSKVTGVTVTPSTATLAGGATVDFDWVIEGTNSPSQAATVTTNLGSINSAGVVIAPAATSSAQTGTITVTSTQDPTKSGKATFTVAALPGAARATYIQETYESRSGLPWANLSGMRWYFFDQVWPAPLKAPVAQGAVETTDGAAVGYFDIAGLTTLLPGQVGTLAYSNTNGDPDQADLMSVFGPVYVH
jgi:hypothetical protein